MAGAPSLLGRVKCRHQASCKTRGQGPMRVCAHVHMDEDASAQLQASHYISVSKLAASSRSTSTMTPHHRQVVTRLYISFGVDVSPTTPRRPHWIVFTNIVRGHHRRQPSTSTALQHRATTTTHSHRQRQQTTLLLLLATSHNYKQKIRV
jgi:hypothetical protein